MSSARVWVMFVVASLLAQCGGAVRIGYGEWQHHRNEEITRRADEAFGIPPAPPIVPSVPVPPPVVAPPVVAPRPTGPIPLSELTQASVGAYFVAHGWTLDSTDAAPEAPVLVNLGVLRDDATLRVWVIDCARMPPAARCFTRPSAVFFGQGGGVEQLGAVIGEAVTDTASFRSALRAAHLQHSPPIDMGRDGMSTASYSLDAGPTIDVYDASEVIAHHGTVVREGDALLVIAVDDRFLGRAEELATELRRR